MIEDRANAFIETYTTQFAELKESDFETLKRSAAEELKKKDKSIAARAGRFNTEAFEFDGNFDRNVEALNALENLTKDQVGEFLKTVLSKETRRMRTTLVYAKEHKAERVVQPSFEDLSRWKKSRDYK